MTSWNRCNNKNRPNNNNNQSYLHETSQTPGAAAEAAAENKTNKYSSLAQSYLFVQVAAETMWAINKDGMDFQTNTARVPSSFSDSLC